jgi:NAD(P)-dependent dehydrogenase (short-subunit alcohol dehydrogenase family)
VEGVESEECVNRLSKKVALVTGGSRGIGRGITLGLIKEGADVIVHYNTHHNTHRERAEEVVTLIEREGKRSCLLKADRAAPHTLPDLAEQAWECFGRIDILGDAAYSECCTKDDRGKHSG